MTEADLMRSIMIALSEDGHAVFRGQVGQFFTQDGRPIRSGLPVGFSDLFGMTACGRFFAIEVKTKTGKLRPEQAQFLRAMEARGGIAFVARSVEEALHEMQARTSAFRVQHQVERKDQLMVQRLHEGRSTGVSSEKESTPQKPRRNREPA